MEIRNVGVIGGGLMGRQIALCAAICGVDATVYDLKPAGTASRAQMASILMNFVEYNK